MFCFCLGKKAQGTIENLVIMGIGLVLLLFMVTVAWQQFYIARIIQQQQAAQSAVKLLSREVNDAYFLGPGTVKKIILTIPEEVIFEKSYISGKTILLHVAGTDFFATTQVDVQGSWQKNPGSYEYTITSFEDFVLVSVQDFSFSRNSVIESLPQNTSATIPLSIKNLSFSDKNVFISTSFSSLGVSLYINPNGFVNFSPSESKNFNIIASCDVNSSGTHSGRILLAGDINASIPVSITCVSSHQKLSILPSSKSITINAGESREEFFLVCNNTPNQIPNVIASISGDVKNFVFVSNVGSLPKFSCRSLKASIVVSADYSGAEALNGTLLVSGAGFSSSSVISLNIIKIV